MPDVNLVPLETRIASRAQYVADRGAELVQLGLFSSADVRFRAIAPRFVSEAYFLLSEAYKFRRLRDGASTQEPKIAALMSMAIVAVWPFQAIHPLTVQRPETVVANPIFAVYCASSIINSDFGTLSNDMKRRLYNFLFTMRLPCLRDYVTDISLGPKRSADVFKVDLSDAELASADALMLIYELLYRP